MNENENEKKPEDGEGAAPDTNTAAPDATLQAAATEPEAEAEAAGAADPAAAETAAPAEAEAQPVAAMFEDMPPAAEEQAPAETADEDDGKHPPAWVAQPFDQPDPGAGAEASAEAAPAPEAAAEPESVPETAPAAKADAGGGATSYAWVTQPFDQPDPGAGSEAAAAAEPEPEPEQKPLRIYEYRFIRVKQNAWDSAEAAILANAAAVADAGGQLYGVWAGQIGLSANQGIVVTVWTDLDAARRGGKKAVNGVDDVAASETLYLEPTARPLDAAAPEGAGVFAHRIFEVRREDTDRFVALSEEAWPQFEAVFGATVFALWRETGHDRAFDRLILLTRYPDYAAWEKSRYWRPDPDPNAAGALGKFRERREITVDTVVYTTRLASAQNA